MPRRLRLGPPPVAIPRRGRLHEGRGVPVPGLRRVLRRVGLRLLVLLARSDRVHRARDSRRPGLPDRLLRAVYRAAAAPPARGRPGRRDTAGHGGTRVLQPAQLVAAVPGPGRRDRRDGRGDRLVAVPDRDALWPAPDRGLRLRVLPRPLRAPIIGSAQRAPPPPPPGPPLQPLCRPRARPPSPPTP